MIHLICPNPALDRTLLVEKIEKNIPLRPTEGEGLSWWKKFQRSLCTSRKWSDRLHYPYHFRWADWSLYQELNVQKGNQLQVVENNQNTRTCNIYVETSTGDVVLFYEKGFELTEDVLNQFTQQIENSLQAGDILVFSGSLMKGMPDDYIRAVY
ncbi:hypothetical protein [Streptococcus suis]|uniref:hypothetical protein n=1 Tax=Streptococcus suis TaxID=1307 RepID=UPI002000608F|nr:hypothetical protein [Streptococcus suis]